MRRRLSPAAAIATALAMTFVTAAPPAAASTFVAMSTSDLVQSSSAAVEAEVLSLESRWTADRRIIVTDATMRVWDVLGGKAPEVVQVKTFGGTVKGFTVDAIGFPEFTLGERVLLFLEPDNEAGRMRVNGYQQGLYRIVTGRTASRPRSRPWTTASGSSPPPGRPVPPLPAMPPGRAAAPDPGRVRAPQFRRRRQVIALTEGE